MFALAYHSIDIVFDEKALSFVVYLLSALDFLYTLTSLYGVEMNQPYCFIDSCLFFSSPEIFDKNNHLVKMPEKEMSNIDPSDQTLINELRKRIHKELQVVPSYDDDLSLLRWLVGWDRNIG